MEGASTEKGNQIEGKRISIRETADLSIYTDTVNGERVFVKEAISENGVLLNAREFYNQSFFRTLAETKDLGFEFLPPTFDGKNLMYPDITESIDWLAKDEAPGTQRASLQEYLPAMTKFIKACLKIEFSELPPELKLDAEKRAGAVQSKLEQDAKFLIEKNLLKEADMQRLVEKVKDGSGNKAFQHHDVVPWHMAQKRSNGDLILVDSGWSGWSLKYYDIAYYTLQMIGYAEQMEEAHNFLNAMKEVFKDDKNFKESLAVPLSYRGVRLAAELDKQGRSKNAEEVLQIVLSEIC